MKLLHIGMILLLGSCSVDKEVTPPTLTPTPEIPLTHDGVIKGAQLTIHGQHVAGEMFSQYARLPKRLETSTDEDIRRLLDRGDNRKENLDSAGLYIAFETDAKSIAVNFKMRRNPSWGIVPDGNERGFDLYSLEGTEWTYVKSFTEGSGVNVSGSYDNSIGTMKKYMILFPTYNGLANTKADDFTITIPTEAKIYDRNFFGEDKRKPILIYGTSVTQGASASRPGLTYTAQVMFEQKREVINMGFAGTAFMFKDMADYMATIPSEMFFIDPTLNICDKYFDREQDGDTTRKAHANYMIKTYRKNHPYTPIVMVSQFDGRLTADDTEGIWGKLMKDVVDELKREGVNGLYFLGRDNFIPDTVSDRIHTTDEGMKGWAKKYNDFIKTL